MTDAGTPESLDNLGFVHKLVRGTTTAPTFVMLHGTGGNEDDLLPIGELVDEQATRLGVRGKVLEGGAPRFFRRLAEGVFDEEDLRDRTHELAEFLRRASETYKLDASRFIAVGYSNGANIAASTLLLAPDVFSAAILFRPMLPFQQTSLPNPLPDLDGRKVFIAAGRNDPIISTDNAHRLEELLMSAGARVTVEWFNSGHAISRPELSLANVWYREHVLGE